MTCIWWWRCRAAVALVALLLVPSAGIGAQGAAGATQPAAPGRTGPGAWPVKGAVYEVSLEYFPNHSLRELTDAVPRLQKLGVSVLYLTPIFRCLGNAQYLIVDYYALNPRYGTEADLRALVATAHQHGIRLLLDLVTSLTYEGTEVMNHHPDWILRGRDGQRQRYYPMASFGWALDCANPEVIAYFTKVARHYVERFDIDGWRVDSPTDNYDHDLVAGDHTRVPLLRSVRKAIDAVKKNALLIGEVAGPTVMFGKPGSSLAPLFDEMLEASYDYPYCGFLGGAPQSGYRYLVFDGPPAAGRYLSTPLDLVVHNRLTSAGFVASVKSRRILFNRLRANFIENHDTERAARAFPDQREALFVLIATMPGVPVIHAGQEIGSTVHPDASGGRKTVVDWSAGDRALESFYTQVMRARASNPALVRGDFQDVWRSGDRSLAYLRSVDGNRVLVALNFGSRPVRSVAGIPLPARQGKQSGSYELFDLLTGERTVKAEGDLANLELRLSPHGYRILRIRAIR